MKPKLTFLISILWLLCIAAYTQDFKEVFRALSNDSTAWDGFGYSVSVSGNYAIVGALGDSLDTSGENAMPYAGAVYIFERDANGNWNKVQKIVASDRDFMAVLGVSVSISGNYAAIGASGECKDASGDNPLSEGVGAVYIFKRNGYGVWNQVQKVVASDRTNEDYFSYSIGFSGSYMVVGAYGEDEDLQGGDTRSGAGSAYIFECDENGIWNEVQKIVASDRAANDQFGRSVSISGNFILVGADREDEDASGENTVTDAGSAYIFERNVSGVWNETQKIVAPVRGLYDLFGSSVSISGNYAVIGAPLESEDAEEENYLQYSGSAYIFENDGTGTWNEVQKIVASDRAYHVNFGSSVSISGSYGIIGTPDKGDYDGSAYLFKRNTSGDWEEIQEIVASDSGEAYSEGIDCFGISVSISGDYASVGSTVNEMPYYGAAYIFESCTPGTGTDPENVIENGNFEDCILAPWYLFNDGNQGVTASAVITDGECTLTGITLSDAPGLWQVQLTEYLTDAQILKLTAGADYTLSFDARAESGSRPCHLYFGQSADPWDDMLDQYMTIGSEQQSYFYDFWLRTIYTGQMRLSLEFGSDATPVTLDNIRLIKKAVNSVSTGTGEFEVNIMPNPATEFIQVIAAEGSELILYNSLGMPVIEVAVTNSRTQLDISDLTKGIYLVEIRNGNTITMKKVIVQ